MTCLLRKLKDTLWTNLVRSLLGCLLDSLLGCLLGCLLDSLLGCLLDSPIWCLIGIQVGCLFDIRLDCLSDILLCCPLLVWRERSQYLCSCPARNQGDTCNWSHGCCCGRRRCCRRGCWWHTRSHIASPWYRSCHWGSCWSLDDNLMYTEDELVRKFVVDSGRISRFKQWISFQPVVHYTRRCKIVLEMYVGLNGLKWK